MAAAANNSPAIGYARLQWFLGPNRNSTTTSGMARMRSEGRILGRFQIIRPPGADDHRSNEPSPRLRRSLSPDPRHRRAAPPAGRRNASGPPAGAPDPGPGRFRESTRGSGAPAAADVP